MVPPLPITVPPVTGDAVLPDRVDVVAIGGGIGGVSTAPALAERKVSVLLCGKGGSAPSHGIDTETSQHRLDATDLFD